MEAADRDGGRGPWCYRDQTGSISSSGTVSTTAYTSSGCGSHLSWISMEAAMHLEEMEKMDTEFLQPAAKKSRKETADFLELFPKETANQKKKMEHIKILTREFFRGPAAKCSIEGADTSVLERWFTELGVGCVLRVTDGAPAGRLDQTLDVSSWIRALKEIMDTLCLMTSLFPGQGSVEKEEPGTESEEQNMTEQAQFASFTQQALLKLLSFVDFTDALSLPYEVLIANRVSRAPYEKLHALLRVRDTLSSALSEIRLLFDSSPSAEVKKILGEIDSVLSEKEGKVGEAIWTEVQEIRTRILESMGDAKDSCHTQSIRESSGIHKATDSVMAYVCFLLGSNYSSVASVVSEAASRGKYVPKIGDVPPLTSLAAEMISCVQEKLANKSEAFQDQSLRFLFLLSNSSFIRDRLHCNIPKSYKKALAGKVDGYMESYIQVSWAPVLACLFGSFSPKSPLLRLFGKNYSPLLKFESEFQKTCNTQKLWKVPDPSLRKTLREAIIEKIVPGYTKYIEDNKVATPKFTPLNLQEMLQELFEG